MSAQKMSSMEADDLTDDDVDKMLFYDVNAISSGYTAFNR